MVHMDAVVFVRPTQENFDMLYSEMRNPKYGKYSLCTLRWNRPPK
jgi:hypothetical protein